MSDQATVKEAVDAVRAVYVIKIKQLEDRNTPIHGEVRKLAELLIAVTPTPNRIFGNPEAVAAAPISRFATAASDAAFVASTAAHRPPVGIGRAAGRDPAPDVASREQKFPALIDFSKGR
ncbi:hypothetical protein [Mesorhizobium sp.]|uniref:hypothetical protein n=1 Tax=Mesorhizobium sp. TaxID=1871066 RepID=UPI000FE2E96C|nr:hypothetical protein [Mesorhizobium sp.]RWH65784.1 MAG: hypothetical protein EOQ84_32220 [Mesorhizobium sp.]RWL19848.1 MAG: hypothetical protein EOR58_31895 [Mesorhizobium sp.]RWL23484.1 MAG: hypothetical protein EOR63_32045 [Mesorhizobium sp.]RWL34839.1 MAG: hypothetical protein EOR59_24075 [Mesorhizobium sp.]RWL44594.1 MAG: hypothetical protein EOR61_29630 [Mesorhizobium sp.]